jgi:hypothetical protein
MACLLPPAQRASSDDSVVRAVDAAHNHDKEDVPQVANQAAAAGPTAVRADLFTASAAD